MIGIIAFLLPLTVFIGLPSSMWNFDGVACAAAVELGQPTFLFHANHLLYGFLGYLFWHGLAQPMGIDRALPALQLFSSVLAAIGLAGLYRLLTPVISDARKAVLLTVGMAATAAFWLSSIEAQVYPLGFIGLAWGSYCLLSDQSAGKYWKVGLWHALAILGHQMHLLWIVPAVYWMTQEEGHTRRQVTQYLLTVMGATLLPYAAVILFVVAPGRDAHRILLWLKGSAGLTATRQFGWHWPGWQGPWIWLKSTLPSLWASFAPYGGTKVHPVVWVLTLVSCGVLVVLCCRWSADRRAKFACLWLASYGLFLSTWEPSTLCYRMPDIIPLALLAALGLRKIKPVVQWVCLGAFLISTSAVNFSTLIQPAHQPEMNQPYQEVLALSKITSPQTLYITSGGLSWIYLLYFTGRTAMNGRSFAPEKLQSFIDAEKKRRPVYVQRGSSWNQAL